MISFCNTNNRKGTRGFSLVEMIVAVAIFTLISGAILGFESDVFRFSDVSREVLTSEVTLRDISWAIVKELRSAQTSATGAYSIEKATGSELVFFSDVDLDGTIERVRYTFSGTKLERGETDPSGNPISYQPSDEKVKTLMTNAVAASSGFTYYPKAYLDGEAALLLPVDVSLVRMVKVALSADDNPNSVPFPVSVSAYSVLRNLKDNY